MTQGSIIQKILRSVLYVCLFFSPSVHPSFMFISSAVLLDHYLGIPTSDTRTALSDSLTGEPRKTVTVNEHHFSAKEMAPVLLIIVLLSLFIEVIICTYGVRIWQKGGWKRWISHLDIEWGFKFSPGVKMSFGNQRSFKGVSKTKDRKSDFWERIFTQQW